MKMKGSSIEPHARTSLHLGSKSTSEEDPLGLKKGLWLAPSLASWPSLSSPLPHREGYIPFFYKTPVKDKNSTFLENERKLSGDYTPITRRITAHSPGDNCG